MDRLQEAIFEIVKNENKRPINQHLLFSKLVKNNHDLGFVTKYDYEHAIAELVATNKVKQLARSGDLVAGYVSGNIDTSKVLKGKINLNLGGNGFITLDGETKSKYYVYKTNLNSAQNGDEVEFSPTDVPTKGELIDAIVTKVLSHAKNFYVGEVHFDKETKITSIKLDDEKSTLQIALDSTEGLVEGSKVLVEVKKYEGNTAYGTVSRIIGHKSDVGVDILSIVYDNGVNPDFPNEVIDYAKKITLEIDDYQRKIRRDLSDKPIVTIDPATSKDFDDAFYCEKITDDKYFLSVQIADVSHYVKHGSVLDKEALKRGCSIYLVDRVIPMLPHNLSDDVCSINPNVPRMAIACDMIIKSDGSFENIKVYPAIIKSHRRFAYDDVNKYFDGSDDFTKEEPAVKESIDNGKKLSDILSKMKEKRGYIEFEIPEPIIKVDEKGIPYEIDKRIQGRAQKMIEDFMVAANEAVTIYADRNHFPFIYRVHDKPNETRLKTFELEAKKLNFKINTKIEEIDSKTVSKWLEDNKDNPNLDLISMMLLRSMAKAQYDTKNIGHFGLASLNYTHFTSPIRRYPDLLVHRIFWTFDFLKNEISDDERRQIADELQEQAELSSRNELTSIKCERDVDAMKFAEYMEKHVGEQFEATVFSINGFGCFAQLDNTIEGFISLRNLGSDYFSYNEKTNELVGRSSGLRISFGSRIKIEVVAASKETRKIEFKLIQFIRNR